MCGIFFSVRFIDNKLPEEALEERNSKIDEITRRLQQANAARGPDAQRSLSLIMKSTEPSVERGSDSSQVLNEGPSQLKLDFFASELRLRGEGPVIQPLEIDGDILCWNGEIFSGLDIAANENDGLKLCERLHALRSQPDQLPELLGRIEGPYALVFYHSSSGCLFFARDPLGRRSLLIHKPTLKQPYFILTSVSSGADPGYEMAELSTEGINCLDLRRLSRTRNIAKNFGSCLTNMDRSKLQENLPFADLCKVNRTTPPEDIPLINSLNQIPGFLLKPVDDFISYLDNSVMLRVRDVPRTSLREGQARVAVLFSGGIDSTVLTFLAHRHLPLDEPIDLLNVAFENPRKNRTHAQGFTGIEGLTKKQRKVKARELNSGAAQMGRSSYQVPDRVTGWQEIQELRHICPGRVWNFIEVDVPYEESQAERTAIEAIMHPGKTVMDLSLAMALFFASRGIGQLRDKPEADSVPYTSTARVLLSGLGSDELLGGYGRHRTVFNDGGWQAVIEELQLELDRLPTRNLGRDDRVISSHGKETRHPFLSLAVVSFLASLPVHLKMDPRLEIGLGDKMLLRLAARKLRLIEASQRKKKAMQFGSHSARMESGINERRGDILLSSSAVD